MSIKKVLDILEKETKAERYRINHQWKGNMDLRSQEQKNTDNLLFSFLNIIENVKKAYNNGVESDS